MARGWHIETVGMDLMENDFSKRNVDHGEEVAQERLREAGRAAFDTLVGSIPVGTGDKRRPAGALRDSARYEPLGEGGHWEVTYVVGDDSVPYAKWTLYKNIHKEGGDYLAPMDDELSVTIPAAMNSLFDAMFGED